MSQMIHKEWFQYPDAAVMRVLSAAEERRRALWTGFDERLTQGINLRSRRGIEGAIWTILSVSLVAVIAVTVLFALGPKLIQLGQNAVGKIQSPPW